MEHLPTSAEARHPWQFPHDQARNHHQPRDRKGSGPATSKGAKGPRAPVRVLNRAQARACILAPATIRQQQQKV